MNVYGNLAPMYSLKQSCRTHFGNDDELVYQPDEHITASASVSHDTATMLANKMTDDSSSLEFRVASTGTDGKYVVVRSKNS